MNLWFRLLWALVSWKRRSRLNMHDVGIRSFRVWPTDLDIFNHMNNGKYLSLLDLSRLDLMLRAGVWQALRKRNWYPVVVQQTINFRKSLAPWQVFQIETRWIGNDDQAAYVESRFVVDGEIYAQAVVRLRFLMSPRGIVTPRELMDTLQLRPAMKELPQWVLDWATATALPKGKEPAPSVWPAAF